MLELKKHTYYFMPVSMGAVRGQPVAKYEDVTTLTALYLTEKDAVAALLPKPFEVADEPIVTAYFSKCGKVDFLAGGGYNIFGLNLSAACNGRKDSIVGNYALVLWENNTIPITLGRELLGAPKLYGDIPDPFRIGNDWRGQVSENGNLLAEISVRNVVEIAPETVQMMEQMANAHPWMSWKYIPNGDGLNADVSRPMLIPSKTRITRAYSGEPELRVYTAVWERCPVSSQVMDVISTLTIKEYRGGFVTHGSSDLLIKQVRPLE